MKKKNSQPQPSRQSRSGRSVRFNLDQNTICDKGGAEYSLEADVYWYTNDQVRSMTIRTARNVETYRQWIAILRRMQDRTEQRRFLSAAVLGEGDEDEACIHGIENLVSKASLRRKIVSTEQRYMNVQYVQRISCREANYLSVCPFTCIYLGSAQNASEASCNRGASSPETSR